MAANPFWLEYSAPRSRRSVTRVTEQARVVARQAAEDVVLDPALARRAANDAVRHLAPVLADGSIESSAALLSLVASAGRLEATYLAHGRGRGKTFRSPRGKTMRVMPRHWEKESHQQDTPVMHAVQAAVRQLAPRYREVLERHDRDGERYDTLAKELDLPIPTVIERLHAARQTVAAVLEHRGPFFSPVFQAHYWPRLPAHLRPILYDHYIGGLTMPNIQEKHGVSLSIVRHAVQTGLRHLNAFREEEPSQVLDAVIDRFNKRGIHGLAPRDIITLIARARKQAGPRFLNPETFSRAARNRNDENYLLAIRLERALNAVEANGYFNGDWNLAKSLDLKRYDPVVHDGPWPEEEEPAAREPSAVDAEPRQFRRHSGPRSKGEAIELIRRGVAEYGRLKLRNSEFIAMQRLPSGERAKLPELLQELYTLYYAVLQHRVEGVNDWKHAMDLAHEAHPELKLVPPVPEGQPFPRMTQHDAESLAQELRYLGDTFGPEILSPRTLAHRFPGGRPAEVARVRTLKMTWVERKELYDGDWEKAVNAAYQHHHDEGKRGITYAKHVNGRLWEPNGVRYTGSPKRTHNAGTTSHRQGKGL